MSHKLDSLLCPQSLAIVGASQREGVVGNTIVQNLVNGVYPGKLYAVNPSYSDVEGVACFPSLADLPEAVEHVIFAVSDERIEEAFDAAIRHGIKAGTIFSSLVLANETSPSLKERIYNKAKEAGVLLCGGNGMGFYNFTESIWACGFDTRSHRKQGNVSLISQSGSGMSGIVDVDERIDFNFAVSTGQELVVTAEDYLDFALEQKETRVIGFFMETSRNPKKLIEVFEKAQQRNIPIVVIKVGRTALSSKLAESHSGAMTGVDTVYDAIFDYYGVQRVDDMEELTTAMIMFAQPHKIGEGGIVSLHDSGGERQLIIDLADKLDVKLTQLSSETTSKLTDLLDPGLPAVNPLDAWSVGGPDYHHTMADCFVALLNDTDAALGAVVHDRAPFGHIYADYIDYLRSGNKASGKPVYLVAARQGTGEDQKVIDSTREGLPVLDGVSAFLKGAKCMMDYRDFLARPEMLLPVLNPQKIEQWREKFRDQLEFTECLTARMLTDFGIVMVESKIIASKAELLDLSSLFQYPLVLKTAEPGIKHKSESDGVILNIENETALLASYERLSSELGPRALVAPMQTDSGVEMILGIANDADFGPMVIVGIGGIYTESLNDIVVVRPPFDAEYVFHCLDKLKTRKILDGVRGKSAVDIRAYCQAAAIVSVIALVFKDEIEELDINPMLLKTQGCVGLDALLIKNAAGQVSENKIQQVN
jgi:acetate---CoA ligase (ADP-forming)